MEKFNMNKYTIIYLCPVGIGNMQSTIVKSDRVETDDLKKLINSDKYNGYTSMIFEGWPRQEGEKFNDIF